MPSIAQGAFGCQIVIKAGGWAVDCPAGNHLLFCTGPDSAEESCLILGAEWSLTLKSDSGTTFSLI